MAANMNLLSHPFWLAGFRPFFALACLSGLGFPVIWALLFNGAITAPPAEFTATQWHAHEMFFGFGWAVIGGFLLTSTKNWVNVRGYHGGALMYLAAVWLFERIGMWFGGAWPPLLFSISNNLFLASIVAMLLWTLIRHRSSDSYRDNYFFFFILPAFLLAKNLMLSADYMTIGWSMAMGLFRMAFLVMLERTLATFMKGVFQVVIPRNAILDNAIKFLGLALVLEGFMPLMLSAWIALSLAILLLARFFLWKPQVAMRRLDVAVMYLGYLAIITQLLIHFSGWAFQPVWVGAVSTHVFTFGAMGIIIPAMLVRISKGHTGRKVIFDSIDKLALRIMLLAFVVRIVAPHIYPAAYAEWIYLSAACWFACFTILAWRYIPFLAQPRVDGKEH